MRRYVTPHTSYQWAHLHEQMLLGGFTPEQAYLGQVSTHLHLGGVLLLMATVLCHLPQPCTGPLKQPGGVGGSSHTCLQSAAIFKRQPCSLLPGYLLSWLRAVCKAQQQHAVVLLLEPLPTTSWLLHPQTLGVTSSTLGSCW